MREQKNKNSIYVGIILLMTVIIMTAIAIPMYFKLSKPKFYKTFIELGNKFLNESKYEEAILEFDKAIHIEPKSTEARMGNGKAYICTNKVDNAVDEFKEAQSIDIENTKLLLEILEILKDIDSEIAYDILQNYIDKTQNTIPDNIQEIINNSNDKTKTLIINPQPGTYINPINIKLDLDKLVVGYTFYYTIDSSEPSKESIKYSGGIDIKEDTTIKLIAYNHKGENSEVIELEYFIDSEMMNKLEKLIKECEVLIETTEEGMDVGNCTKGSKQKFKNIVDKVKHSLSKGTITYEVGNEAYGMLVQGIDEFKYNIIEKTNKNVLKDTITKAQNIHDEAVEGNNDGQFKVGSKSILLSVIKESQNVYDDILSKQEEIDNSVYLLNQAINIFNNSKVNSFTKSKALDYFTSYFDISLNKVNSELYTYHNGSMGFEFRMSSNKKIYNNKEYYVMYALPERAEYIDIYIGKDGSMLCLYDLMEEPTKVPARDIFRNVFI